MSELLPKPAAEPHVEGETAPSGTTAAGTTASAVPAPIHHDLANLPPSSDQVGSGVDAPKAGKRKRRRKLGFLFWLSVVWMVFVVFLALFGGLLHLPPPNHSVGNVGEGPGWHHLLGTDLNGDDLFSRIANGSRVSLTVGFFAIAFGLLVGGIVGLIAGYYRGRVEAVLMSVVDILLAFPALVFALAIVTFIGRSVADVTLTLGVLSIAPLARVVRGSTIVYSQREFVLAARTLGASGPRIVLREVLPNVVPAGVSFGIIGVAVAMVAEGALSFLGLSVNPQTPSWGGLIAQGQVGLGQHPMVSLFPAAFLFLTVLALNFAGDALRAVFDVKEAGI
jgi:peptide/nickel transport system permease protein